MSDMDNEDLNSEPENIGPAPVAMVVKTIKFGDTDKNIDRNLDRTYKMLTDLSDLTIKQSNTLADLSLSPDFVNKESLELVQVKYVELVDLYKKSLDKYFKTALKHTDDLMSQKAEVNELLSKLDLDN